MDNTVPQKIVIHKDSQREVHFRHAGPRQKVYFSSDDVHACIVTCGGLCPGLKGEALIMRYVRFCKLRGQLYIHPKTVKTGAMWFTYFAESSTNYSISLLSRFCITLQRSNQISCSKPDVLCQHC